MRGKTERKVPIIYSTGILRNNGIHENEFASRVE
jgi:hypothetical protein